MWLGRLPVTAVTGRGSSGWAWLPAHIAARRRWDRVTGEGTISAAPVAGLRNLTSLGLRFSGPPGVLTDAFALSSLPLAHLTLIGAYGLDTLPELPALTADGVRRTTAGAIRARYRRGDVHLTIRGAKDDSWLATNLANPFRDWADDDPSFGTAA
ncbi:hypothetical protein [Actinoplanes sp. NPDC051411]|uniref:hypothetical protein n=1 Tax=Actinoplanes sp. NPDC051411 TaxID=3155522 RepID=UPI003440AF96